MMLSVMRLKPSQTVRRVLIAGPIGSPIILEADNNDGITRIDGGPQCIAQLLGAARHGRKPNCFERLGRGHFREKLAQLIVIASPISNFQTDDEICHISTKVWTQTPLHWFSRIRSMSMAAKKKRGYR